VLTALTLMLLIDADFTRHVGEFVGGDLDVGRGRVCLIAAAQDLLVIFIGWSC